MIEVIYDQYVLIESSHISKKWFTLDNIPWCQTFTNFYIFMQPLVRCNSVHNNDIDQERTRLEIIIRYNPFSIIQDNWHVFLLAYTFCKLTIIQRCQVSCVDLCQEQISYVD